MKKVLSMWAMFSMFQTYAQKIPIEKWLPPRGFSYTTNITEKSTPYRGGYYNSFFYVPATTKPLRLDISSDSRTACQVKISNKKGLVFETKIFRPDTTILLPTAGLDTLYLYFVTGVQARGSVQMEYALVDADTATTVLSSKPKVAFEQIINATQTNFTTLVPRQTNRTFEYRFEKFGFAPLWTRLADNTFKQSLGTDFTAEQALADLKKWAKQMEDWLKPYGAIESKFYSNEDLKQMGVIQRHEIIKKNKKGLVLFKVVIQTLKMENFYNVAEITAY